MWTCLHRRDAGRMPPCPLWDTAAHRGATTQAPGGVEGDSHHTGRRQACWQPARWHGWQCLAWGDNVPSIGLHRDYWECLGRRSLSWLSLWAPTLLMENKPPMWKWMSPGAVLAYGTMQLDGCPKGNSWVFHKAIYIWISSHIHFNFATGIEPIVCMKNNAFIMIISTTFFFNLLLISGHWFIFLYGKKNQSLNKINCQGLNKINCLLESDRGRGILLLILPLSAAAASDGGVLKVFPGKVLLVKVY